MGIQGFFGYFFNENKKLKDDKKFIYKKSIDEKVSRLYVDFINIVHDILGENKELDNGEDSSDILIIKKVIERLKIIFDHYPNSKKLIFFECIPTVAKIREQYSRRIFKKIQNDIELDLKEKLKCPIESRFDQNKFSIDSQFILKIIENIKIYFREIIDEIEIFDYKIGSNEIGEAEHRIINHIFTNKFINNDKFVIYSPDADVFLLSTILTNKLSTTNKNITINTMRRSDDIMNREFYFIDTEKYINFIVNKVDSVKNKKDLINDTTYIFNLLGDDFIPIFDKFKNLHSSEIFPIIFKLLKDMNFEIILMENSTGNYHINKTNLLIFFENLNNYLTNNVGDVNNKNNRNFTYKYILEFDEKIKLNKLVYNILSDAFSKGYYFYEKSSKSNSNNFFINNLNFEKNFNNTNSKFLVYNTIKKLEKEYYEITINNSYKSVSMLEIDNKNNRYNLNKKQNITYDEDKLINYFQGYQFVLDLYYNTPGLVLNNFWYYQYNDSPSLDHVIKWLKANQIPNYINENSKIKYFTANEYKKFLLKLVENNYQKLLKKINQNKIMYDNLILIKEFPSNMIFDCFEKKYINKCEIRNQEFINPIDYIRKRNFKYYKKYSKYKKKYLKLKLNKL